MLQLTVVARMAMSREWQNQWVDLLRWSEIMLEQSHEEDVQAEPQETADPTPTPPPEPVDTLKEAEKKKEAGNVAFRAKNFTEAIERYTEAIGALSHIHASIRLYRPQMLKPFFHRSQT